VRGHRRRIPHGHGMLAGPCAGAWVQQTCALRESEALGWNPETRRSEAPKMAGGIGGSRDTEITHKFDQRTTWPQFSPKPGILTAPGASHIPRRGFEHCSCAALPQLPDWSARHFPSGHHPVTIGLPGSRGQGTILSDEVAPGGAGELPERGLSPNDKRAIHVGHCEGSWNRSASSRLLSR